jgi:hypothetical protein
MIRAAFDGSHRVKHEQAPRNALERGPVWIVNVFHGNLDYVAPHASLAGDGDEEVLVLYDDQRLLAVIPSRRIGLYEIVTVVDPQAENDRGLRLWSALAAGDRVTLVHADTGYFD